MSNLDSGKSSLDLTIFDKGSTPGEVKSAFLDFADNKPGDPDVFMTSRVFEPAFNCGAPSLDVTFTDLPEVKKATRSVDYFLEMAERSQDVVWVSCYLAPVGSILPNDRTNTDTFMFLVPEERGGRAGRKNFVFVSLGWKEQAREITSMQSGRGGQLGEALTAIRKRVNGGATERVEVKFVSIGQ